MIIGALPAAGGQPGSTCPSGGICSIKRVRRCSKREPTAVQQAPRALQCLGH